MPVDLDPINDFFAVATGPTLALRGPEGTASVSTDDIREALAELAELRDQALDQQAMNEVAERNAQIVEDVVALTLELSQMENDLLDRASLVERLEQVLEGDAEDEAHDEYLVALLSDQLEEALTGEAGDPGALATELLDTVRRYVNELRVPEPAEDEEEDDEADVLEQQAVPVATPRRTRPVNGAGPGANPAIAVPRAVRPAAVGARPVKAKPARPVKAAKAKVAKGPRFVPELVRREPPPAPSGPGAIGKALGLKPGRDGRFDSGSLGGDDDDE